MSLHFLMSGNTQSQQKEKIIKIRAEINDKEAKETIAKINKAKSWFFERISKIDKPLAKHQETKGEESNQQNQK